MLNAISYVFWLIGQVVAGAVAIGFDMCKKRTAMKPIVVEYPLRVEKPWQIAGFTTSITMTPGTLSCGVIPTDEPDKPRILLVQAVYGADPDEVVSGLADMEERMCPSVKDIDWGAPGQGPGDPDRSTVVAGHSDTIDSPTEKNVPPKDKVQTAKAPEKDLGDGKEDPR